MAGAPIIETAGLTKEFDGRAAVSDLDLTISAGEVFGFLGPNGAGKTTTIRLLLGLLRPTAGTARLFGLDARRDVVAIHRRIGYVPGETALWPSLTGRETLELFAQVQGVTELRYRDELVERFAFDLDPRVRAYSKGNRQKLLLIAALMGRPALLLLDEPSGGLDPLMARVFRECVAEAAAAGQTVFLSSHTLSEVESLATRVGLLRAGRLVDQGTLADLRHLQRITVEVRYADQPAPLDGVPGVTVTAVSDRDVTYEVTGPMGPLIAALDRAGGVERILGHEPSLEELFLAHYGQAEGS